MTIERKFVVGLEDIKTISFECVACSSRMTVLADNIGAIPSRCQHCNHDWSLLNPSAYDFGGSPFLNLTMAIQQIRSLPKDGLKPGFRVLLEFEQPD